MADTPLTIDVIIGRMDTPEQAERIKKLYKQLQKIGQDWNIISPAPAFKITQDKYGQVHCKLNDRMVMHMLAAFSDVAEDTLQEVKPEEPPEWFMRMMGGEPYTKPAGDGGT